MFYNNNTTDNNDRNELGYKIENYYDSSVTFEYNLKFKCSICNNYNDVDQEYNSMCEKCDEYYYDTPFKDIKNDCENNFFDIEESKELSTPDVEIYKIKLLHESLGTIYGIMLWFEDREHNEWSSTPANYFFKKITLYDNVKHRNDIYDKYEIKSTF